MKIELDVPITALHKKVSPTNFVFSLKEKCIPHDALRFATLRPIPEIYFPVCSDQWHEPPFPFYVTLNYRMMKCAELLLVS